MKEEKTYIGGAEIRMENVARRDKLVKAAENAGFIVKCSEAINISLSGASGPEHWAISVYAPGVLDKWDTKALREKLAASWAGL